jgi:site-specific DNA recombinase
MKNNETKIKYFLYARKSSEGEDRQVQSIGDQTDRITKMAEELHLDIVEILSEAKSAKNPYCRPVFDNMLKRIEDGEANGILCWEINRLSRNPVDSGKIQWMLQKEIIQSIKTINREYKPDDNALLLSVESGSANQFILDLKKGVKRGIDSKITKGNAPILAPLGYLNSKFETRGENYIKIDPERFPLIRKAFDMMLTGNYPPPKILEIMNNEWGMRTRKTKRKGGNPIGKTTLYDLFSNIFYAGFYNYQGKIEKGIHEPMITLEEFDRVQILLGREGRPRPKTHDFPFTGIIRCGECGSAITAIERTKIIKTTGELKTFTYYYCTRRKLGVSCTQKTYLSKEELEIQINTEIAKIEIHPIFKDWALNILQESNNKEIEERTKVYDAQHKTLVDTQRELDNLTKMRYRELINDTEYIKEKKTLQDQITILTEKLRTTENRAKVWIDLTEKTFKFACYARYKFETGDIQVKRELLSALGQNYTLKDQKILILPNEWLKPIILKKNLINKKINWLELENNHSPQRQKEAFASIRPMMRERPDLNRRPLP